MKIYETSTLKTIDSIEISLSMELLISTTIQIKVIT